MPDDTSGGVAAQTQSASDQLLNELQSAVSAPVVGAGAPTTADTAQAKTQMVQKIKQAAEDAYWTPRRQMEQAIAARDGATARVQAASERIAQLKQQIKT